MEYKNIKEAKFLSRPNRFIAEIDLDGKRENCHVKNTGRCKELLIPGATIFVQEVDGVHRKTKYDLVGVLKGDRMVNIDSQVPNKVFHEWLLKTGFIKNITLIKPEFSYKNSRFDFYIETTADKILIEVKGVTLEENGIALFPDAPTERGVKHLRELIDSVNDGFKAYMVFIIQVKGVLFFTPNNKTHQAFGDALRLAKDKNVNIIAIDCKVTKTTIEAKDFVEIKLDEKVQ